LVPSLTLFPWTDFNLFSLIKPLIAQEPPRRGGTPSAWALLTPAPLTPAPLTPALLTLALFTLALLTLALLTHALLTPTPLTLALLTSTSPESREDEKESLILTSAFYSSLSLSKPLKRSSK